MNVQSYTASCRELTKGGEVWYLKAEIMGLTTVLRIGLMFDPKTCTYNVRTEGFPPDGFDWNKQFTSSDRDAALRHYLRAVQFTAKLSAERSI